MTATMVRESTRLGTTMTGRPLVLPTWGTPPNPDLPTLGHEVAEVMRRLGTPLMPWQEHVVDVALEYDPATGRLAYDEVDLLVMRRAGKTALNRGVQVRRCVQVARRLGPQLVMYTAQRRADARKKLELEIAAGLRAARRSFTEIENPKARPKRPTEWKLSMNNGAERITFGTQSVLQIDAPVQASGHGDDIDQGTIDEAWYHVDDAVEQGMRPAMATRAEAQLWVQSAPGNERSAYLYRKVLAGRAMVDAGVRSSVAFFEWGIPDDADIDDEQVWWDYMPMLGLTVPPEFIRGELEKARRSPDPTAEDLWRRSYGGQWVRVPVLNDDERPQLIDLAQWALRAQPSPIAGAHAMGVDVSPDGRTAALAIAGYRADGAVVARVLQHLPGTWWLEARIANQRAEALPVAIGYDNGGPSRAVAPEIGRGAGEVPVLKMSGPEWAAACGSLRLRIEQGGVFHWDQAELNDAVAGVAKKMVGKGMWIFDALTSTEDISPLCAVTAAVRALESAPTPEEVQPPMFAWT